MANDPQMPRAHGRPLRAFLAVTATFSLLIVLLGAVTYGSYEVVNNSIGRIPTSPQPSGQEKVFGPCVHNVCNYLLLGSDSRAGLTARQQEEFGTNKDIGGSQRADTIILVHTDPKQEKALLLSFPRDLWVHIPGHGVNKINSSFAGGINGFGAQLVTRTVQRLTGLKINHVLYVDLAGFEGVVNAIGGVDMCVPNAMVDPLTALDIPAGCQHFDGRTALAYVRTRHQPCDASAPDFYRIGRQQQFLRAVLNKLLSPGELIRLPTLVRPVFKNLVADDGFNPADIAYLVKQLQGISTGAADFRAVPGTPGTIFTSQYPAPTGISIVRMDPAAKRIFRDIRQGKPLGDLGLQLPNTALSPANIVVGVFDKSSGGGARTVFDNLNTSGFDTAPGLSTDLTALGKAASKGAVILYRPGQKAAADVAAQNVYPALPEVQAPRGVLTGMAVAVVVTARYHPSEPPANTQPTCVQ